MRQLDFWLSYIVGMIVTAVIIAVIRGRLQL